MLNSRKDSCRYKSWNIKAKWCGFRLSILLWVLVDLPSEPFRSHPPNFTAIPTLFYTISYDLTRRDLTFYVFPVTIPLMFGFFTVIQNRCKTSFCSYPKLINWLQEEFTHAKLACRCAMCKTIGANSSPKISPDLRWCGMFTTRYLMAWVPEAGI